MSVTWIDPPGRLAATREPLDFTTSKNVTSISIEYDPETGQGMRETVYDGTNDDGTSGGDFPFMYHQSTRTSRTTWRVVRNTPWPAEFRIRVQEVASAQSSTWTTLYECDLRNLPNQTITGATENNTYVAFTMDGQPWYYHSSTGKVNLVHGTGLVGTTSGFRFSGNPYAGFYVGLKVYQMAGWDPHKETCCQVKFAGNILGLSGPLDVHVGCGIWSGPEIWGNGPGNNSELTMLRLQNISWTDGVSKSWSSRTDSDEDMSNFVLGARVQPFVNSDPTNRSGRFNYREGLWLRDCAQPFGDVESTLGLGCENGIGTAQDGAYKMGFFAGNSGAGGALSAFTATHIRILQRAVT